ncbi:MAG: tetratricopeptide repeat protein [Crocinitomix sp.]|nr:tetratricopeptide repeat protein [Crocinitomix sp.]
MVRVYIQTGYEYEALSKFEAAVDLFEEMGDTNTVKAVYLNIGAAYHELEYHDLAEKYYMESMEGDGSADAFAYNNLGEVALGRKQYLTAKDYFEKSISLQEANGDIFYLFSDGVTDQFGGKRNKKFTTKRLLKLIVNGAFHSMDQNKAIIENALEEWQGSAEQTNDIVCVGFKLDV